MCDVDQCWRAFILQRGDGFQSRSFNEDQDVVNFEESYGVCITTQRKLGNSIEMHL